VTRLSLDSLPFRNVPSGFLLDQFDNTLRHALLHCLVPVPIPGAICLVVAPGAAAEMSLIALALHAETALDRP